VRWTTARDRDVQQLFDTHYHVLCKLAFVLLRDSAQAEEEVMDAFVKTFAGWKRIGSMDRPDLYLRRVVVNGCNSRLRRRALEARMSPREVHAGWDPDRRDSDRLVREAIDALPKRKKMCVVLRYYEDLSEAEMAEVLECSEGTIKSQLAKARQSMKRTLDQMEVRGESRA
jgi:RNA polymerase sigma-70 factor (sigma-E family)